MVIIVWLGMVREILYIEKEVFVWGCGEFGRLGLNNTNDYLIPTKISYFKNKRVSRIFCGAYMSAALVSK